MDIKEAGSVVENYAIEYVVNANGSFSQSVSYRMRVQAEDAKVSESRFPIEYNSMTDTVEVLEAFTQNGKTKIPVEKSAIEDRDRGEAKDYDAIKVRSVVFPQVEIGSRLHLRYVIRTLKPLIENRWSTNLSIAPGTFVEKMRVVIDSKIPLHFQLKDPGKLLTVKQKNKFHLEVLNQRRFPGWVHAEKDPFFHPARITKLWISTHPDWSEFFSPLSADFAKILNSPLPKNLKPYLARAREQKGSTKAEMIKSQVRFLLERMSHDFRYFGDWRRHNGGVVPRTLLEIEKSRYGDCKDLASLLTVLLRNLNIRADVALVYRGENSWLDEPNYTLPEMGRFNHAIVRAQVNDEVLWLDPTNSVSSLAAMADIAGKPAWILTDSPAHFERIPQAMSQNFHHLTEYQYTFHSNNQVKVHVSAELKQLAPFRLATELMNMPRSQVLSETLDYFSEGHEVRSFRFIKEPVTERSLSDMKVGLEYDGGRITFNAGKAAFFVLPDGFLNGAFFETEKRVSDLRLATEPYLYRGTRHLKATRLAQDVPEPCVIDSEWVRLERRVAEQGQDVVIYQDVDLKRPYIQREEFRSAAFVRLQEQAKKCMYRAGILIESRNGNL